MHAGVAVAVGDVEVALGSNRDVRRAVERAGGPRDGAGILAVVARVRRLVHGPKRHQELPVRRELADGVVAVVRAVEHLVRPDADAVGPVRELALAPGAQKPAARIVDDDGVIAAADQVDPIFGIHRHARHVAVCVAAGQLLPAFEDLVTQRACLCHDQPPRLDCGVHDSYRCEAKTMRESRERVKASRHAWQAEVGLT